MLASVFLDYTGALDHAGVLHLGGVVRRLEPVRLHHAARSSPDRLVPDHGPVRPRHRHAGAILPAEQRPRLAISVIGVLIFAGLTAWTPSGSRRCTASWTTAPCRPQGGDGRVVALSRLHQPVPDDAAADRRPPLSRQPIEIATPRAKARGVFFSRHNFLSSLLAAMNDVMHPAGRAGRHRGHHPHLRRRRRAWHGDVRNRPPEEAEMARRQHALLAKAILISSPSEAARWRDMPMPALIAPGRPTTGASKIRSTSRRNFTARASAGFCSARLIANGARGFRQMIAVIGDSAQTARSRCTPPCGFRPDRHAAIRRLQARPLARHGADAACARRAPIRAANVRSNSRH